MSTRASSTFIVLFLGIVQGCLVTGCGVDATDDAGETPMHYHMVCVSPADAQTEPCYSSDSLAFLQTWVQEALSLPDSTFTIWAVDPASQQFRHISTACVPRTWGASVQKKKADFITRARQGLTGTQHGQPVQDDCHPPQPHAPGIHQLAVSPAGSSLHPDVLGKVASASPAPSFNQSVVCDASASTLGVACNATSLLRAFDFWVAEGLARPGSSLSVAVVGPSRDTMRTVFELSVPDRSIGERIAYLLVARVQLAQLPGTSYGENASALVEAINVVVSKLRERQGRYALIVLSDLRQLSSEWDFDEAIPHTSTFLKWLKKTHLLPDLRDFSSVLVCGMHNHRSPGRDPYTAKRAAQLQELWQRTFHEAGAPDLKLFTSCDSAFAAVSPRVAQQSQSAVSTN
jgi:hypothetical protein